MNTTDETRPVYQMPNQREVKRRWAIGIDPDLRKNGFAVYDRLTKRITLLDLLSFYKLIRLIQKGFADREYCDVYMEAGWLHDGLYNRHEVKIPDRLKLHPEAAAKYVSGVRERKSKNVGENHAAGKLLAEFLTEMGYVVNLVKPEKGNKWTPEKMKMITGIETKNQEKIDATHMCYGK